MSKRNKRRNKKMIEEEKEVTAVEEMEEAEIEEEDTESVMEEEEEVESSEEDDIEEAYENKDEDDDDGEEEVDTEENVKEITIDMSTWGIPVAIIIAAIIIAVAVFITNRQKNDNYSNGNNGTTNTVSNNNGSASQGSSGSDSGTVYASIDGDPYIGTLSSGKVAIVEYSDPLCYYCQKYHAETYGNIKKDFVDTDKIIYVFKDYSLGSEGSVRYSIAEGGMCVYYLTNNVDAFLTYHNGAFDIEDEAGIQTLAQSTGVDMNAFNDCLANHTYSSEITADRTEGSNAGVTGTPAFLLGTVDSDGKITGTLLVGAQAYSTFKSKINSLLGE